MFEATDKHSYHMRVFFNNNIEIKEKYKICCSALMSLSTVRLKKLDLNTSIFYVLCGLSTI